MADPTIPAVSTTRLPDSNPHSCEVLRSVLSPEIVEQSLPERCLNESTPDPVAANDQACSDAQRLSGVCNGTTHLAQEGTYTLDTIPKLVSCGGPLVVYIPRLRPNTSGNE